MAGREQAGAGARWDQGPDEGRGQMRAGASWGLRPEMSRGQMEQGPDKSGASWSRGQTGAGARWVLGAQVRWEQRPGRVWGPDRSRGQMGAKGSYLVPYPLSGTPPYLVPDPIWYPTTIWYPILHLVPYPISGISSHLYPIPHLCGMKQHEWVTKVEFFTPWYLGILKETSYSFCKWLLSFLKSLLRVIDYQKNDSGLTPQMHYFWQSILTDNEFVVVV